MRKMQNRQGSALIITFLLVTIITTISFAVSLLGISEFRKTAALQDSISAYYAAEAGLEHGLMQYRLWHDAEISKEAYSAIHKGIAIPEQDIPTKTDGQPQTFSLAGLSTGPGFVVDGGNKGTAWYDLKMHYRDKIIGKLDSDSPSANPVIDEQLSPRIYRDGAAQYSIKGARSLKFVWRADPDSDNNPFLDPAKYPGYFNTDIKYFVELILISSDRNCPDDRIIYAGPGPFGGSEANRILNIPLANCKFDTLRIKPWNMSYMQYSLSAYGLNGDIIKIGQQSSTIQSVGRSGNSKRFLDIRANRSSGTILESEDFLLFSSDKEVQL